MKRVFLLFPLAGVLLLLMACSKNNNGTNTTTETSEVTLPTVIADSVGDITMSTASFFCKIISNGGGAISDRGIYYGKVANPVTNKTAATTFRSGGEFELAIKQLEPNTTYYVRGYATNS